MKHREQILEYSDEPNLSYKVFHARGLWCTRGRYKVFRQTQTKLRHLYSMQEVRTEDWSLTPWISSSSIISALPQTNIEIIRFVWTESHPEQQILLCSAQLVVRFIFCCCFFSSYEILEDTETFSAKLDRSHALRDQVNNYWEFSLLWNLVKWPRKSSCTTCTDRFRINCYHMSFLQGNHLHDLLPLEITKDHGKVSKLLKR